jgi:ribosomal protein S18 acetylase RimI-like enzyme
LDREIRDEVEATLGWRNMPAEVLARLEPAKYAVAAQSDRYVGLARVAPLPRQPRIGLIAVRADMRRRGIARALLAEVLGSIHRRGIPSASADVNQSNQAALALFEGVGARRASSNLELVVR